MTRKIFLIILTSAFFACNSDYPKDPHVNILVHHSNKNIKDSLCIQKWDSALAYSDMGDFETALKLLQSCNEIEPNNSTILNALGVGYFANKDSASALKYYYQAIKVDSLTPEPYASAGCLLEMQRKYREAINILEKGYNKSTLDQFTHYNICLNLAITYYSLDSCAQTEKYLAIAKKHGFDMPQFDKRIQQFEKEAINYCNYYKTHKK